MTGSRIKILICYHKPDYLLKDDILTPIHVGRYLAKKVMSENDDQYKWLHSNLIGDDTGDNISEKNSSYNELTAVYWAWKNYEELGNPEYIGLMHYRRHFVFREMKDVVDVFVDKIDDNYFSLINYTKESIMKLLSDGSSIFHEGKVDSIRKHYADNHNVSDLDSAISIIDEICPSYSTTAHNYLKQDRGSFCNMFIFPKDLFFEYCEWLFKILKTYEDRHDLSEKRLFISERLTGIFIQKKINDGISFINLPITLIKEPITVPIAMPWTGDLFSTAVTIISHILKKNKTTSYKFYIIGYPNEYQSECLMRLSVDFGFDFEIINPTDCLKQYGLDVISDDCYPLILHLLLPKIGKCIYLNNKLLSTQDESEFYRTCNVDDFWISGIPESNDNPTCEHRKIILDLLVLNLKRFRDHNVQDEYEHIIAEGVSNPVEILHLACGPNIGYCPPWFYKKVINKNRTDLFDSQKNRGSCQYEAGWSSYVYYNEYSPIYSMQGIYSILWWNVASKVPGYIQQPNFDIGRTWDTMVEQQHRINQTSDEPPASIKSRRVKKDDLIESKMHKFKNAYEKHGFKEAVRLGFKYIRGTRE